MHTHSFEPFWPIEKIREEGVYFYREAIESYHGDENVEVAGMPKGTARLRVAITAGHRKEQLDRFAAVLRQGLDELAILRPEWTEHRMEKVVSVSDRLQPV